MEVLRELTYIVSQYKVDKIPVLDRDDESNSSMMELFEKILSGDIATDEDAEKHFFPNAKNQSSYRKFKNSYRKLLTNTAFFIDLDSPAYNNRQKAFYECYREWAAAKILLGKNARMSAVDISERILRYAIKYEFTELVMDISRVLRLHYGTRIGNKRKFDQYNELYYEYKELFQVENIAEEFYAELTIEFVNKKQSNKGVNVKALEAYEKLKPYLDAYQSYGLHLYAGLINFMIYSGVNNYEDTLIACDRMINVFEAKPYTAAVPLQIAYYQKVICHIHFRDYENGKRDAEHCIELIEHGSFNWFKYMELYFILLMHTQKYQEAYELYKDAVSHKRFKFLPENISEIWNIYKAYLHYLMDMGKVVPREGDKSFTTFKLNKFLNELPTFSMDKRGVNIAILVLQIVFLVKNQKYNRVIDYMEAIEKYVSRYLNQGDTIRSKHFIKMLLTIPSSSFHQAGVERKSKSHFEKLMNVPMASANSAHKIEIIPYEHLWEMCFHSLNKKFYMS